MNTDQVNLDVALQSDRLNIDTSQPSTFLPHTTRF